jgi:LPS-assembly protein
MNSRRRRPSASVKHALFSGAALAAALWPLAGHTQAMLKDGKVDRGQMLNTAPKKGAAKASAADNNDGLQQDELYMEADQLVRDEKTHVTTAEGSVEIRYEHRTLRADRVVYEEGEERGDGQGVIRAFGHVQIINDDGTVDYADQFTLDDKMRAGVALGFSTRLQQDVKIAGASAIRRNDTIQELNKAIFTPCPICQGDKSVTPTWSISADRVVEDKTRRIIYYKNAHIHVKGATVLFLPLFWHADPSAQRASGFLTPKMGVSDRRGFSYEQPYLFVLSPSSDLTLSPQFNTKVNPFLNGHYRQRFATGDIDVRFGYTYDRDFDGTGKAFGDNTSRSYILARGSFQIDDHWRWGFTAERVSDDLIFDKYEIGKVYEVRGPYVADDRRLISQLYATRQDDTSYFSIAAFSIQGLRPGLPSQGGDNDRTFPVVAPLIEEHYDPNEMVLGGRIRFNASAVALTREEDPTNASVVDLPGIDSRRLTVGADWQRSFIFDSGLRVDPYINVRADGYSLGDLQTYGAAPGQTHSALVGRALGVAGADISYPVYRRWNDDATIVLEPLVQLAVSPDARQIVTGHDATGKPIYLNEDSVAFEFDETTLFQADKFPGYDLYEDGARVNVAGRASVLWDDGRRASFLLGRSFRDKPNDVFSASSGLQQESSDWIVATDAQPIKGVTVFARARLDADSFAIHRAEAGINVNNKWGSGYVRYLTDDLDINGDKTKNLDLGGELYIRKNWGVSFYGNRDMLQNAWVIRDIGVFYRDDCTRVDVIYRREDTVVGRLGPSSTVSVRLTLATLGGPVYGR